MSSACDDAQTALLVPMLYRGDAVGVLAAFDRGQDGEAFTEDDEQMLRTFAASAATAVALAQSVQADRLRSSLASAEAERRPLGARAARRDVAGSGRPAGAALLGAAP